VTIEIDDEQEIRRLASLTILQYERERDKATESLGMRASALDEAVKSVRRATGETKGQGRAFQLQTIEPWASAVEGAELLRVATEAIKRYVVLPANSAETIALWAVHTHCFNCFGHSPRAAITSPEQCDCCCNFQNYRTGGTNVVDRRGRHIPEG
jgi:hypothetical protein